MLIYAQRFACDRFLCGIALVSAKETDSSSRCLAQGRRGQCPRLVSSLRRAARAVAGDRSIHEDGGELPPVVPPARRSFFIIDRPIDTLGYSAFRTRGRVVLRAGRGGQHVRDEFRRSRAGEHSRPGIFMAEPRRTPGTYASKVSERAN
jgi:hypothetical protein